MTKFTSIVLWVWEFIAGLLLAFGFWVDWHAAALASSAFIITAGIRGARLAGKVRRYA